MKSIIDRYLDRVLLYANKPEAEAANVRQELRDHLLQKVDDLVKEGVPREEAALEALRQHGPPRVIGYKLRGAFPWIDIRAHGTARGVIAIGPRAVGVFAFGGMAFGIFACGGAAVGVFSAGGVALGLLFAWAGLGIGAVANAGLAVGVVATGGLAIGLVAAGGLAIGAWTPPMGPNAELIHYYTANQVPPLLKSLEPVLQLCLTFDRYVFVLILPAYLLMLFALNYLKYRENKRVASGDDWLIDG